MGNIQHIDNITQMLTDSVFAYGAPDPFGVCHADDLYMLFDPLFVNWIPDEGLNNADSSVSDTMIELWKNFIKTGNPSTTDLVWDPINDSAPDGIDRKYLWLTDPESSYMEYP